MGAGDRQHRRIPGARLRHRPQSTGGALRDHGFHDRSSWWPASTRFVLRWSVCSGACCSTCGLASPGKGDEYPEGGPAELDGDDAPLGES